MKHLALAVCCVVIFSLGGCFLNPDNPAEVVLIKWETEWVSHQGWYTATFENVGEKNAKNVRVKLERPDGSSREGHLEPDLLTPGFQGVYAISRMGGNSHPAHENRVVWVKWDD